MGTRTYWNQQEQEGRLSGQERSDREDQSGAPSDPEISSSKRDTPSYRMRAAEAIGELRRNGRAPPKHNKTKHDEMKSKTNAVKLMNLQTDEQMQ
jgi:hypothetical protein